MVANYALFCSLPTLVSQSPSRWTRGFATASGSSIPPLQSLAIQIRNSRSVLLKDSGQSSDKVVQTRRTWSLSVVESPAMSLLSRLARRA